MMSASSAVHGRNGLSADDDQWVDMGHVLRQWTRQRQMLQQRVLDA
eukprot:gene54169-41628_t